MELNTWIDEYVNDERTKEIFGKWAEEIAEEKGYDKGVIEEKNTIAKNMLKDKIDTKTIMKYTGLTLKEIKKLND